MRVAFLLSLVLAIASLTAASAQPVPDFDADVAVALPAFEHDRGPSVLVDGGHHNFQTADGRFGPFANLLRNDGFRVAGSDAVFSARTLAKTDVLVIANALNRKNVDSWILPTPSAFTAAEIAAVKQWVENGGALLLIANQMPFAGAATDLAAAFDFKFVNGFARRKGVMGGANIFSIARGTLANDPILNGRATSEVVTRMTTFAGSAFKAPLGARPLFVLPASYEVWLTESAGRFLPTTEHRPAGGLLQGAVMEMGKGRIAVFGDATMFSAQRQGSGRPALTGFNAPEAPQNKQFVLNLARWLAKTQP